MSTTPPGAEIARRVSQQVGATVPSDDEIRRLYRIAEGLAMSGVFKDAKQANQAFAKLIYGKDLGLSPARAMSGLHFVEGNVQMHYRALGAFVRENGYHYVFPTPEQLGDGDDQNPSNARAAIDFYGPKDENGDREFLGRSRFTQEDAATAGLDRDTRSGSKSNYIKFPRNMLVARAMSNGVGWYCPEVLGGIPVYVEGEIPPRAELGSGQGSGEPQGLDLGPKVEEVLARAEELGSGLADRATVEMMLGGRSPAVAKEWVEMATAQLDRLQAERIPDAEVVPDEKGSEDEPPGAPEPADGPGDVRDHQSRSGPENASVDVEGLRGQLSDLYDRRDDPDRLNGEAEDRALDEEIESVEAKLAEAGAAVPGQEAMEFPEGDR